MPVPVQIGRSLVYDKAALFSSGAVTLQDLLDRIPGITGFRAGWIAAPTTSAFMGDVRRVRVFMDGVEYDPIDPRTDRQLDLTEVPLWTVEELRIEPGATEVRVYLRTWRVDRTTPYTRTDIFTGDQQTNMYRGFFGKRWGAGEGLQVAAQQYGTTPPFRGDPSSDQLSLLGRLGWAKGRFSVDAFALRTNRTRGTIVPHPLRDVPILDSVPALQSSRTDAYVRAGWGDPEQGPWLQAIASSLGYSISHKQTSIFGTVVDTTPPADTNRFQSQYVVTGGLTLGMVRLDGAERLRVFEGRKLWTPSGSAELVSGPLALSAFFEGRGPDSLARVEATARLTPLPFVSLLASAGRSSDHHTIDSSSTINFFRGEAGIRLFDLWVIGGVLRRDSTFLAPPLVFAGSRDSTTGPRPVFGSPYITAPSPAATGITAAIRGPIYKALGADLEAIRWNDSAGFYRPHWQTRSEVYLATNWLSRFPSGNFGIRVALTHEYRSRTYFPVTSGGSATIASVPDSKIYNFQLDFRILSAVLSYQFRNLVGYPYQTVPGLMMPRQTQFYGVRWEFWN